MKIIDKKFLLVMEFYSSLNIFISLVGLGLKFNLAEQNNFYFFLRLVKSFFTYLVKFFKKT